MSPPTSTMPSSCRPTMPAISRRISTAPAVRSNPSVPSRAPASCTNTDYWGDKALPDRVEIKFFDDEQAQVLALQAGQLDVIPSTTRLELAIEAIPTSSSSACRQARMTRCICAPTRRRSPTSASVARWRSPSTARRGQGPAEGRAIVGNDTPFAPIFPRRSVGAAAQAGHREAKRCLARRAY